MQIPRLPVLLVLLALTGSLSAYAQTPSPASSQPSVTTPAVRPVVVSGTVPDEATRQVILSKLRAIYGAERIVDQLGVGNVAMPPNWADYAQKLLTDDLKQISNGQFDLNGNNLNLRGDVSNEHLRQDIPNQFAARLNPTYQIRNSLRVGAGEQQLLDKTLANRIVEFQSGLITLTPRGVQLLDEMLAAIRQVKNQTVQIIGHTDSSGRPENNALLSQARAEAVRQYFVQHGLEASQLVAIGKGAAEPIATNDTAEGRARNRRIEFRIAN